MSSFWIAILALFLTSMVTRVLPIMFKWSPSEQTERFFGRVLPFAVFLNFSIYLIYVELNKEFISAFLGITAIVLAIFLLRLSILSAMFIGCCSYIVVTFFIQV